MFFVLSMNQHRTVYVSQRSKERWYFVSVASNGTTVNV